MELTEILAISGAPGLYKYVAQGKGGIIVESLADQRRTMVSGSAKVSALGDIAIFTDSDEVALGEVFQTIFKNNEGKPVAMTSKSTPDELHAFMASVLPAYDRDRVHNSDIKKLAQWYNTLVAAGMTEFVAKKEEEKSEEQPAAVKAAKAAKPAAAKRPAAAPKASGSKAAASRSTTARKAQ